MGLSRLLPLLSTGRRLLTSLIGGNRQGDMTVFHKVDAILDESRLSKILNYSFFTESLRGEERDLLYKFLDALQSAENQHLHPVIELRAKTLAEELSQLLRIVGSTFRSEDGEIFRFRPDTIAYDRAWDELQDGIEKTWKAYRTYRQVVKDRLKV